MGSDAVRIGHDRFVQQFNCSGSVRFAAVTDQAEAGPLKQQVGILRFQRGTLREFGFRGIRQKQAQLFHAEAQVTLEFILGH